MSVKWQKVKLGDVTTLIRGKYITRDSVKEGDIPVILGGREPAYYCDTANHDGPCVVISRSGASAGFVTYWNEPICVTDGFLFEATDLIDIRYLYFCLKSQQQSLNEMQNGAGIPHVTGAALKSREIPFPPLPVQKKIASILSAYDDLIENNRRRIAILEEMARKVYRKRFGGKKANGTIADLATANDECYKAVNLPSEINYVDIASVSTGRIDGKTRMDAKNAPGRARRIARHGDVIWSNVRPNLRAYALVLSPEDEDVFSTGFTVLRAAGNLYSYLYLTVTLDKFVSYLEGCVSGATYPAVRPDDFLRAEVYVPSNDERLEFQELTEPLYDQVCTLSEENCKLAEARDVLLPKLMGGRG